MRLSTCPADGLQDRAVMGGYLSKIGHIWRACNVRVIMVTQNYLSLSWLKSVSDTVLSLSKPVICVRAEQPYWCKV